MNWFERITAARERGFFLQADLEDANQWPTCACGEQSPGIPRFNGDGAPIDLQLREFGRLFNYAVTLDEFDNALALLHKIEKRAGEVLMAQAHINAPG